MKFRGQICDGCHKSMDECEDIVVCPVCGTPQHRECWEKQGECVNAAKHAEGFVWQEKEIDQKDNSNDEKIKCTYCGEANPKNALSCNSCGAPLPNKSNGRANTQKTQQNMFESFFNNANAPANPFLYGVKEDPNEEIDGVRVSDIACFVQSGVPKYIGKFKKLQNKKGKIKVSFNWAAFFFSPIWFFYRKLWKMGIVFAGLLLAVTLAFTNISADFSFAFESYIDSYAVTDKSELSGDELDKKAQAVASAAKKLYPMSVINILIAVTAGFVADPLYKKYTIKKIKEIKEKTNTEREFEAVTLAKGGTSFLFAFIAYFSYNIIYRLLLSLALLL